MRVVIRIGAASLPARFVRRKAVGDGYGPLRRHDPGSFDAVFVHVGNEPGVVPAVPEGVLVTVDEWEIRHCGCSYA